MPTAPASATALNAHRSDQLTHAHQIATRLGITDTRAHHPQRPHRRGAPAPYTPFGVITTQIWLALTGRPFDPDHVFTWLWTTDGFTDDEMTYIHLPDLRHTNDRFHHVNTDAYARDNEKRRLRQYVRRLREPCRDPTCPIDHDTRHL